MLTLAQLNGEGKGQVWITQDKENSPKINVSVNAILLKSM